MGSGWSGRCPRVERGRPTAARVVTRGSAWRSRTSSRGGWARRTTGGTGTAPAGRPGCAGGPASNAPGMPPAMADIRANTVLPARREPVVLETADGLHLVGELALPESRTPVATLILLHPLPTHGG